ncbi:MAG: hypothetical protein MK188_15740, partial [Gammaproteobacteria bacterium]|nr:hypothetical protein [Gammaproteobacteria bacterium]
MNSASVITYRIVNPNPSTPIQNLTINETLPSNLVLATDVVSGSTDCSVKTGDTATITGTSGAGSFAFSGYTLGAGESCQIRISVTSGTAATYTSPSASLFSDQGETTFSSASSLTVSATAPTFTKVFAPSSVNVGERTRLPFTVDNTNNRAG